MKSQKSYLKKKPFRKLRKKQQCFHCSIWFAKEAKLEKLPVFSFFLSKIQSTVKNTFSYERQNKLKKY